MHFSKKNVTASLFVAALFTLTGCGAEDDQSAPPTSEVAPSSQFTESGSAKVACSGEDIVYYDWTDLLGGPESLNLNIGKTNADTNMQAIDLKYAQQVLQSGHEVYVLPYAIPVGCGYRAVAISDLESTATAIDSFTVTYLHESDPEQLQHRVEVGYDTYVHHPDEPVKLG